MCQRTHPVFYLSESGLKDLDLIHHNFPNQASKINASAKVNEKAFCGCFRTTTVPDKPDNIPFPRIESNRHCLERWLRNYFRSCAFNLCPHQPLQMMKKRPLDICFVEGATPLAVHTPIPVLYHWKKSVKQDFHRYVALNIIEPIPAGTPTTWCSRIVVAPKKGWFTEKDSGLTKAKCCYDKGETLHSVPVQ